MSQINPLLGKSSGFMVGRGAKKVGGLDFEDVRSLCVGKGSSLEDGSVSFSADGI